MIIGIGMARAKKEGHSYLYDTGEDVTILAKKAEKLYSMLPKSAKVSKKKFIYNFIMVSLDRD